MVVADVNSLLRTFHKRIVGNVKYTEKRRKGGEKEGTEGLIGIRDYKGGSISMKNKKQILSVCKFAFLYKSSQM